MTKWVIIFLIFLLLNVIYLDWKIFFSAPPTKTQKTVITSPETMPSQRATATTGNKHACAPACLSAIEQATAAAKTTTITKTITTGSSVREYFIPFGSGSSSKREWTDVGGLSAYINTANYPKIKKVTFEVSVSVPTGNETVNVRLYNATDDHPVWFSDVYFDGGTNATLLISQPITLDPGKKLYQVQMKTQLTYPANLDQARVRIITY